MTHFNIYLILLSILFSIFIANTSLSNNNKIIISILNVIYLIYKIIGNKNNNNSLNVGAMVKIEKITSYTITKIL